MLKLQPLSRLGLALALLSPTLFAQSTGEDSISVPFQVANALSSWQAEYGASWHVATDEQTGYAQLLYGGSAPAAFEPQSDKDFASLARVAIEQTADLHGIEAATLVEQRVLHLPLGLIDSTDKMTVRFTQGVNGVPVLGAYVNALFDMGGNLLSVQTTAMPGVAGTPTDAVVSAEGAAKQALEAFEKETGLPGILTSIPVKAIGQLDLGPDQREAVLVWQMDVEWSDDGAAPEGYSYWVDARNGGVLRSETTIHNFDVGGTLSTMASPGILPDQSNNPEAPAPMNRARVSGSGGAGTVFTDQNGNFNFPGVTGPINITVEYFGDWADVRNDVGADHSEVFNNVSGTGNALTMNSGTQALITSQSNCFEGIGLLRDWIRSVNPSDNTADFRATSNANLASTCNAFFNGNSVNFYQQGGGCNATSYSTVIAHEMGHWFNVLYGTGNGSDGMGEGNADVFGMFLYNTNRLGADFQGQGSGQLRNGNNTRQFCGDSNPGCYGGVHTDGQVWMGAAWKIYLQLENAFGASSADMISDSLFLGWMNAYNQTGIKSIIEIQWLTLDDDNGNIDDGTPHYPQIDAGFRIQGFPGYDLPVIDITSVTALGDQSSEQGPYVVDATVDSLIGATITGMDLFYSVNGGSYSSLAMTSTGGNGWTAGIPGQVSPATVRYYVQATDTNLNVDEFPEEAPAEHLKFVVGIQTVRYLEDFESGEGGWTHGTFGDTSNDQDDWQYGVPGGESGDPSVAGGGFRCWGNDLAIGNFNGAYQNDVHNFLRSPSIDCSNSTSTFLRFKRWLTVQRSPSDRARIRVNGQIVWVNPSSANLIDENWTEVEYDISSLADGNPSVEIEFSLLTNGSQTFGGWTVDDVEIVSIEPTSGACVPAINYGIGKLNSVGGQAFLTAVGEPSEAIGAFPIDINAAVPNTFGVMISAATSDNAPLLGGTRLVGVPFQREVIFQTDGFGYGSALLSVPVDSSGSDRFYQAWYRDVNAVDGTGAGLSDGLQIRFCD